MGRCAEFVLLREFRFVPHGSSPQFPLHLQVLSSGLLSAAPGSVDTGGSVVNLLSPGAVSVVVGGFTVAVVAAVCFPGLATIRRFLAGSPSPLSPCVSVVFKLLDLRPCVQLEDLRFVVPPSIDPSVSDELTGACFFLPACFVLILLWKLETLFYVLHNFMHQGPLRRVPLQHSRRDDLRGLVVSVWQSFWKRRHT